MGDWDEVDAVIRELEQLESIPEEKRTHFQNLRIFDLTRLVRQMTGTYI